MNKMKICLLAGVLCAAPIWLVTPVYAHGGGHHGGYHGGHHGSRPATVRVCTYEDCALSGRHLHNGVAYCGNSHRGTLCQGLCRR